MSLMPNELVAQLAWDSICREDEWASQLADEAVRHARLEIALELRERAVHGPSCAVCRPLIIMAEAVEAAALATLDTP